MLVAGLYLILVGVVLFLNGFTQVLLLNKKIKNITAYVTLAYSIFISGGLLVSLHILKSTFNLWQ